MKKKFILSLLCLTAALCVSAQNIFISEQKGEFPIVAQQAKANFVVDANDAQVVTTAANAVANDIKLITGQQPSVDNVIRRGQLPIIAGTLGKSKIIDQLAGKGIIDAKAVKGKWECFGMQIVDKPQKGVSKALVIYGSDPRGTAYGIFEISRRAGVSPYVWWADVAPAHRSQLWANGSKFISKEPSVKFRGMFINDEDWGIMPWAAAGIDKDRGNIGPHTYEKVMELLLRLRANTLWPAMHACSEAFFANKANIPVAKKYDIVLGSSHCEQMERDNLWEYGPFLKEHGLEDIPDDKIHNEGYLAQYYNWPNHSDYVKKYWAERVGESRGIDVMYTLGMRGVHDRGINGYKGAEATAKGLADIIAYQRQLISDSLGGDPTKVPQIFIPYKEVLEAYNAGLKVPEDVTLCWVDDNHGYIRQLPTKAEQARSGGNGIYYHLSYYGTPESYVWLSTVSPTLASFELTKGYQNGMRNLWIINVGDIKPNECEFEFCMDLAYDINSWTPENAWKYSRYWCARTFGEDVADDLGDIKQNYYRLAASGKPEHVFKVNYTDGEKNLRIDDYLGLAHRVDQLKGRIPQSLQDAYFELIEYPVKCAGLQNVKIFRAEQSREYAKAGYADIALRYGKEAQEAYNLIQSLTAKYNTGIANGKWNKMMDCYPTPNRGSLGKPRIAAEKDIASTKTPVKEVRTSVVKGSAFTSASKGVTIIKGLGTSDEAVTVWPMDMKAYTAADTDIPYVEYQVPVHAGTNEIIVRCLCSFPVNESYDLRTAVSIDGSPIEVQSVKTKAMSNYGKNWNHTVLDGFSPANFKYDSDQDKTVTLRVYFMDPGLVINDIYERF